MFRTYEPDRDRLVAVKVFRLDITPEQAQALADELSRAAEAGLFHPSIVEPIAAGVQGSVAYNAEEYVAAESLDVAMRHYAPAQVQTVLPFITQLAGAIDFSRAAGVGHGALHPRDVFMTPDEARATGFGVVEALERVGLRAPVRRPYSSPERIEGRAWSTAADVFSLAAIAYELLTGRRPSGLGKEIGALNAGPESLHAVLARAMDADPARRYQTALAFASALEAAARGVEVADSVAAAGPAPVERGRDAITAAAPAVAAMPSREPAAKTRDVPATKTRDVPAVEPDTETDDILAEKDEDDAHHRLTMREREAADARESVVERESSLPMDEDSEIEAEADRYAADDFLLDAAGAASAPALSSVDSLRASDEPVDQRALDDDEVMVDEPPSPLFQPEDLLHEPAEPVGPARRRIDSPVPSLHPSAAAPSFGHYSSPAIDEAESGRGSRWSLALMLLLGALVGFVAGYAVWGRAPVPVGREFSEQTIAQPPEAGGKPESSVPAPQQPSAAAPPSGSAPPAEPTAAGTRSGTPPARSAAASSPPSSAPAAAAPPVKPSPQATRGTLIVRSTPNGAGVTINGQWRGRTPLTLDKLAFARYDVRVVQPGYTAARETITLSPDEPARSVSVRLQQDRRSKPAAEGRPERTPPSASSGPERYTGTVFVDSRPRGARVFIDGKPVGTTPLSVSDIPVGSRVVRLELPDHRIWSTSATVSAGQQSRVTGSLERIQ